MSVKKLTMSLILALIYSTLLAQVNFTSSNLPIIIINTNGQDIVDDPKIMASMGIIDNGAGNRNNTSDSLNGYSGKIGIEIRGHSSQMFPKKQYGIELWDDSGNSVNASLLGMPAESDWVLNASYTDKTFLRNVLAYKLGSDLGRYASRTKFCEVVINNQYKGIYILQEKVKRNKNRVNIKKLEAKDISGDALTGGYILNIDRIDPGDKYFNSVFPSVYPKTPSQPSPISYIHIYPNAKNILPVQHDYIQNYITQFETSLSKSTYNDPFLGYYDYIDIDSFVDYFLVTEFVKTVDAYRLSAYLYKDRDSEGGKLSFGPMWDYDLSFGLADYGDAWLSSGWQANAASYEGIWSTPFWIKKIFNDPVFVNKLAKRWNELKNSVFDLTGLMKFIDQSVMNITEARIRNFNYWPIIGAYQWPEYFVGQSYEEEIVYLKGWIIHRYNWIDSNLPSDYANVEWLPVDFSQIKLNTGATVKFPVSMFVGNYKNVTSLGFVCQNPDLNMQVIGDSVALTVNKIGKYVFKGVARKNNSIVSISNEYKIDLPTGVGSYAEIPRKFELAQNYPNPFNPSTTIKFSIPAVGRDLISTYNVMLKVYDILGREVATLVNEEKPPGYYEVKFDGTNLSSGVYFYTLRSANYLETQKMVMAK